jgi:HTH-type transcriptional regulator / antitoxin HipB
MACYRTVTLVACNHTVLYTRGAVQITTVHQMQALVRGRRTDLNLSQESLAQIAGVSRKWLSEFERGATTAVELPLVLRVLAALDLVVEISANSGSGAEAPEEREASVELDLDDVLSAYRARGLR